MTLSLPTLRRCAWIVVAVVWLVSAGAAASWLAAAHFEVTTALLWLDLLVTVTGVAIVVHVIEVALPSAVARAFTAGLELSPRVAADDEPERLAGPRSLRR